jgi:amino acid transporter
MMAYVFADYAYRLWNFGSGSIGASEAWVKFVYAIAAVGVLSFLNILGVVFGKGTQNILTAAKVLGLGAILLAGFLTPQSNALTVEKPPVDFGGFGLAMVLVLYTYGGWNDAALVAAEQRNRKRNIPRALIIGTVAITLIYVLINAAYVVSLGFEGARQSNAVAADVLERAQFLGQGGSKFISLLVMISALGAVNGMIFTGSRVYSTLGSEYSIFAWLGRWHKGLGSPVWSLVTQMVITLCWIAAVGTEGGRSAINMVLARIGLSTVSWEGHGGFESLLNCTAPAFWLFFLLTGLSLFVLREKDHGIERPFSVPLYPLLPIVFCNSCAYMLYSSTMHGGSLALVPGALVLAGLLFHWASKRKGILEEQPIR